MMNLHQPILPNPTIVVLNVFILGTQAMNPNIGYTTLFVNYQTTWSQPITPIIPSKINALPSSTYPMWCNVIPRFVPLNLSLYLAYPIGIKRFDPSIFKNYISYVPKYPVLE